MGLDIYLRWPEMTEEDKQAQYRGGPGYLRSSYNESGFNAWAERYIGGKDFYYIFSPTGGIDADEFKPDWSACMRKAQEALALAEKVKEERKPRLIEIYLPSNAASCANNPAAALAVFEKVQQEKPPFAWFSNRDGHFFMENPPKVMAAIVTKSVLVSPSIVLVCEPAPDEHDYYVKILRETVAFIELGKAKDAMIKWSG